MPILGVCDKLIVSYVNGIILSQIAFNIENII